MYKLLLAALAPGAALAVPQPQGWTQAQRYPAKTIELVVSYRAGGSTDLIARAIAQKLQDRLGQSSKDARAFLARERDRFGRVVRDLGIMMY